MIWRKNILVRVLQFDQLISGKDEVEKAHNAGIKVLAWFPGIPDGPEDLEKFLQLKEMGVDVLCTNRPDIAILDLKNDWK